MDVVTRFAPSPSGVLHLGHAYSALRAWDFAQEHGARFLLRIEDIDTNRCKPEYESLLQEDLQWLGLEWETPVRRQSDHLSDLQKVADDLLERGFLYPCFCTRREIQEEIARAGGAPHGVEGPVYPGTCRSLSEEEKQAKLEANAPFALRLNLERALQEVGAQVWQDLEHGSQTADQASLAELGDAVLVRKDIGTSYHLAVVHDDQLQGVTHIIRGFDLFQSTHLHRILQALLGYDVPVYCHHELIKDERGKRLAKRDESETLRSLRESGVTLRDVRRKLGL